MLLVSKSLRKVPGQVVESVPWSLCLAALSRGLWKEILVRVFHGFVSWESLAGLLACESTWGERSPQQVDSGSMITYVCRIVL